MKLHRPKSFWMTIVVFAAICVSYQNCTPVKMTDATAVSASKADNGGPYSGMAKVYHYFNSVAPCSVKDFNGSALANTEVLFKPDANGMVRPFLARESCTDLPAPTSIADSDLKVTPGDSSQLVYKNTTMTPQIIFNDFSVVRAACPAGKTEIAGAVRTNVFLDGLDWSQIQPLPDVLGWRLFDGIGLGLDSTIQSLPAFSVVRNDPAHLEVYNRIGQYVHLKPSTEYAVSFLTKAGTVTGGDINIFRRVGTQFSSADESILATCNLATGKAAVQYASNLTGVSVAMTPVSNGYLCTVYFTTSTGAANGSMDIGYGPSTFSSNPGKLGDSVIGAAAQLVEVNQYCK